MSHVELVCGDCRDLLKEPTVFDFMVTSPPTVPYSYANLRGIEVLERSLLDAIAKQAGRTMGWSLIFVDDQSLGDWMDQLAKEQAKWRGDVVWSRTGRPIMRNPRPPTCHELVVTACPSGLVRWNGPAMWRGFDQNPGRHSRVLGEKPLDLALEAIQYYSNPGDTGVDGCNGTGTFAVAAWLLGRDFLGIEINQDRAAIARERLTTYQEGRIPSSDQKRLAKYLLKHPESQDLVLSKFKNPKVVEAFMRYEVTRQKNKLREMVLKFLADDASGDREYATLVKGLYT